MVLITDLMMPISITSQQVTSTCSSTGKSQPGMHNQEGGTLAAEGDGRSVSHDDSRPYTIIRKRKRKRTTYEPPSLIYLCLDVLVECIDGVPLDHLPYNFIPPLFEACFYDQRGEQGLARSKNGQWLNKLRPFLAPGLLDELDISWIQQGDVDNNSFGILLE